MKTENNWAVVVIYYGIKKKKWRIKAKCQGRHAW